MQSEKKDCVLLALIKDTESFLHLANAVPTTNKKNFVNDNTKKLRKELHAAEKQSFLFL
jgi:hypothetical protein